MKTVFSVAFFHFIWLTPLPNRFLVDSKHDFENSKTKPKTPKKNPQKYQKPKFK